MESQAAIQPVKQGRIKRGWALTKSSWHVLRLDKEIAAIPLISMAVTFLALIPFMVFGAWDLYAHQDATIWLSGPRAIPFWFSIYLIITLVSNFFSATIAHAVITRFRGGDPTVRSSLKAAWKRADSIILFSLFAGTVGYILTFLEQRVPLAGKIAVWLVNAAWSVATFFAIPVIVTSDTHVGPIKSVRESVGVIKRVWGESAVSQLTLGLIGLLATLLYSSLLLALVTGTAVAGLGFVAIGLAGVGVIGLLALILIFGVLGSIAKAAVFHYATTGESPESFNRELLQTAMTPKKARKLFV